MNDINKKLWYQALDKAVPETYTQLSPEQLGKAIDAYTELIVKECMGICGQVADDAHKQKSSSFLTADGKQLYNGVWGGAMNCGAGIANHFGIEK